MKKTKTQKGITLIALIITIIILLILAVVAIKAIQNDGIIEHAKNARESYQTAQRNEQAILDSYLSKLQDDKANPPSGGNDNDNNDTPTLEGTPCTACDYGYLNEKEEFVCSSCGGSDGFDYGPGYHLVQCETHGLQILNDDFSTYYSECPICYEPGTHLRWIGSEYGCDSCGSYTLVAYKRCPFKCTYGVLYGTAVALMGEDSVNVRDTIELTVNKNDGTTIAAEDLIWDSSDKTVATVSNGVVTGVKALEVGTAKTTITATSKTDSSVVVTKEISVTPIECTECTYGYLDWIGENPFNCPECGELGSSCVSQTIIYWCNGHAGYFLGTWGESGCGDCGTDDIEEILLIADEFYCENEDCYGDNWSISRLRCPERCTYGKLYS